MVADHRQHHLAVIRDGVASLAYPIQWAVQAPVQACAAMRESFATKTRVEAENVKLAADNLVLRLKLLRFESLEQENRRLRAVRESSARVVQRSLVAEIVRVDLDPFRQRVLINKGTRADVVPRPGGHRRERHLRPGHARRPLLGRDHPDLRPGTRDPGAGEPHRRAQHRARHRALGPPVAALPAAEHRRDRRRPARQLRPRRRLSAGLSGRQGDGRHARLRPAAARRSRRSRSRDSTATRKCCSSGSTTK